MSKYCPILDRNVVYLECLECDERICRDTDKQTNKNTDTKNKSEERGED